MTTVNTHSLRSHLQDFQWKPLFIEVLGWSNPQERAYPLLIGPQRYQITPIAQLGGMHVYVCTAADGQLPDGAARKAIERQVKERQYEHLILFEDGARQQVILQWMKRGQGTARSREYSYTRGQSGDQLLYRLSGIAFDFADLDDEGKITIDKVSERVAKGLDVESVTKKFYTEFTSQREAFEKFLRGIPEGANEDARWYVSVMLNRLMFIYFMQSKGFLAGNTDYLQDRLEWSKNNLGPDRYYRDMLRLLFFEGFAREPAERSAQAHERLGSIPYLNGGLFLPHPLEECYAEALDIPDAAFERLYTFFGKWRWHLSERPGNEQNEIDPDVLGYIFEKYINQKQMGAYYTKEDITGYICRNTIIPRLFDKARLSLEPLKLPQTIRAYIYPTVLQRDMLPTETEREYQARQQRAARLIAEAEQGQIASINDAITANMNLEAMIFDLVPVLDAQKTMQLYTALTTLSVLDPTCGSGAFLFAAIRILKPIYEQVLERMAVLQALAIERRQASVYAFGDILQAEQAHANRDYFITKSIIVRNLYGVDIMEEATEICKLRLFLRLVADIEDAVHIEPLPDIDFNIRAGNALVGYTSLNDVGRGYRQGLGGLPPRVQKLLGEIQAVQHSLSVYRSSQLELNPSAEAFRDVRRQIRDSIAQLNAGLDSDMRKMEYIHQEADGSYNTQPFHWFTAFYEILEHGGFDVIVGNPPYVEYTQIKGERKVGNEDRYRIYGYKTESCGNLYAYVMERCLSLSDKEGRLGFIVPVSSISTERYNSLQVLLAGRHLHYSSYDDRPSRLFEGLEHIRLTIHLIGCPSSEPLRFSTRYNKWSSVQRELLFHTLSYTAASSGLIIGSMPKLFSPLEPQVLTKLEHEGQNLANFYKRESSHSVFYSRKVGYFLQILDFEPLVLDGNGIKRPPSEFKEISFQSQEHAKAALCCLNSSLFYWFITVFSDCRHVNKREIDAFPIDLSKLSYSVHEAKLQDLAAQLMAEFQINSEQKRMRFKHDTLSIQCIYPKFSKPIIDEIDRVLAQHYGFTEEELDFIINYDIKYRMGRDADDTAE